MIIYCIISYLIMFGILLSEHDNLNDWQITDILAFIFAPLCVPVIFGMSINEKH